MKQKWDTIGNENFEDDDDGIEIPTSPAGENNNLKNIHINTEMNRGTIRKSEFKIFTSDKLKMERRESLFNQIRKINQSESNKIIGLNKIFSSNNTSIKKNVPGIQ